VNYIESYDITGEFRAISEHEGTYSIQKLEDDSWITRYEARFQPKQIEDFTSYLSLPSCLLSVRWCEDIVARPNDCG
jgi:DNA-binding Lrp family transcriptional regulator